ncbi:hypothetical protein [Streptomyces xylophagus]|uniref:hypothetical protein n=1 Tax=Streptomyces xylophagus TaxID=285514 RepID=UPI00131B22BB|nr:hypothetical protein [Streptomyces xylophagus]
MCEKAIAELRGRQLARIGSVDTCAGFLIGAAGVLIGFGKGIDHPNYKDLVAQGAAALAGLLAAISLAFRGGERIRPREVMAYASFPKETAFIEITSTSVIAYEATLGSIKRKLVALAIAGFSFTVALGFVVFSTYTRWRG